MEQTANQLAPLIPYLPAGLVILGLITMEKRLSKRPTWDEVNKKFKDSKVCDEIHKSVDEKLTCMPIIKDTVARLETKVDIIIENNGK